jgi:3D (Asp-Asp-Asp) domain-containing protein
MKKLEHNVLIHLFTKALKTKGPILIFLLSIFAVVCVPLITSHAYYFVTSEGNLTKIQKEVAFSLKPVPEVKKLIVTAFSSTVAETDDTPCLTAIDYDLCKHNVENVVACNFLPFGTKVVFPQLDPNKYYTVVDRMHEKYDNRIDIWRKTHQAAEDFGLKYLTVEIYRQ